MKKIVLGVAAAVAAVVLAEEVSLNWVFSGYFENISVSASDAEASVDASLQASAEAELDLDSSAPGMTLIIR